MKRKVVSLLLLFVMFISCLPSGAYYSLGGQFVDVNYTYNGCEYVEICVKNGIMRGTGYNTFSPDSTISIAEVITIAVRLAGFETDNDGENWYDGAVNTALQNSIISEGQFDRYTRAATRAEVAGILGKAQDENFYEAKNKVCEICDVDEDTPYSAEIYKLYRAGVLRGNSGSGAFEPYKSITRAEVATIAARIIDERHRLNFIVLETLDDHTVKTTDKMLDVGGVRSYGIVEIGGKYFVMPEIFKTVYGEDNGRVLIFNKESGEYYLDIKKGYNDDIAYAVDYEFAMPSGIVLGEAHLASENLYFNYKIACYNSLYIVGGKFPLVSLDAIGAYQDGDTFVLPLKTNPTVIHKEADLVGRALKNLQRESAEDTALAIHDYIVNTLTYDPLEETYEPMTQAELDEVTSTKKAAEETYHFENNIALASKYGVCHHYSTLVREMCLRSCIPAFYIGGRTTLDENDVGHAWNQVYIDGKWLYIDATWDDPVSKNPRISHSYFLVDADVLARNRIWEEFPMPPKYDPEWEKLDINNITSADMFRKCLVAQIVMGKKTFSLHPVDTDAFGGNFSVLMYPECVFTSIDYTYNIKTHSYDYVVK